MNKGQGSLTRGVCKKCAGQLKIIGADGERITLLCEECSRQITVLASQVDDSGSFVRPSSFASMMGEFPA